MKRNEIIRTLRGFVNSNRDRYEIIRIGVFGSAARDKMDEQSDVDIVVELEKPDLFYLVGIKQDLEEKFHRPVDIVRYRDRMNAFLKKKIDKEAVYV
ncbi:MAG: nucleotidyltransferase domain-containing protein [Deltaproteobacteria bacterium]|nr:nucleotidyltransferase domain-containing protein [Deltaproteobacteria bacterium]MBW2012462.1 nucleotidyltransferase domain-containing protein [Deltaproteobacteria bacterium]MBW2090251.1 nucleotidyltransferase domain-containing protein [Deltaproteobacteria bacterium]MBW2320474.1 nucleotidyltransferase domain-containing protein [Deltaproteobacteria bacterium]